MIPPLRLTCQPSASRRCSELTLGRGNDCSGLRKPLRSHDYQCKAMGEAFGMSRGILACRGVNGW